jgi:predicted membrane protein
VSAKTGGGNVSVEIGGGTTGSNTVTAKSGAGNVVVCVPSGLAAKIHASSGLGRVVVESCFSERDGHRYQSPDYDDALNKTEIMASSGAGNVTVNTK